VRYNLKGSIPREKAQAYLDKLMKKGADVEIIEKRNQRSLNQNGYWWVLVQLYGLEIGYTKKEAAIVIKNHLGMVYEKDGYVMYKSSADLDTKEFAKMTDELIRWAGDFGISLPSPEKYKENRNEYDNHIEQNT